ncbi:MAG: TonB-dependent receptor [Bacteroidota bacterium]
MKRVTVKCDEFSTTTKETIHRMKINSRFVTSLLLFLLFSALGSAQKLHEIKGKVVDSSGNPLIGVNVMLKGTSIGTITNNDGGFVIKPQKEGSILVVSYIGYSPQELKLKNEQFLSIELKENAQNLSEIQVIGYGQKKKVTMTGAVVSIGTAELLKSPAASVGNMLAGNLSGVSSIQYSGQPGADNPEIYVRGIGSLNTANSTPLMLVDGVERSFFNLDPNEIESVSVLKDASATAVFGVRGANGVILVTTRRGQEGQAKVSVTTSYGTQVPTRMVKFADGNEWVNYYEEALKNDVKNPLFSNDAREAFRTGSNPVLYPNVDWMKLLFKESAPQSQTNINISGGTKRVRYFTSLGSLSQDGLFKNLDDRYNGNFYYNRYNYRTNLDIDFSSTTTMKINLGGRFEERNQPNVDDQSQLFRYIYWAAPLSSAGLVDGKWVTINKLYIPIIGNDGLSSYYGKGFNNTSTNVLNIDVDLKQKLDFVSKGLSFRIKGAYNSTYNHTKTRSTSIENYTPWLKKDLTWLGSVPASQQNDVVLVKNGDEGVLSYGESFSKGRNWYAETSLDYARDFGDHHVTALLLYNQSRSYYPASYTEIPTGYVGLVGRVTYDYKTRYLLDVNMGYNGSENFPSDAKLRFGLFPSISGGWIISEENFMKNQKVVDFLKLRASYGVVGNDKAVGGYRFLYLPDSYVSGATGYNFGVNVTANLPGISEGKIGNPGITWETSYKQNYGIDLTFLKNRLTLNLDVFSEHRIGILATSNSNPGYIAMNLPVLNLGQVDNNGTEVSIKWRDKIDKLDYFVNFNISYTKNRIMYQDEVLSPYSYQWRTGKQVGQNFGKIFLGFYQNGMTDNGKPVVVPSSIKPGDAVYRDLNGDGVIDGNDDTAIGFPNYPSLNGGITLGFNYKGFSFSMLWTAATMTSRMLEETFRTPLGSGQNRALMQSQYDDRWTPETAATATLPRASFDSFSNNYSFDSSLWMKDASYVRLKTIEISQIIKFPYMKKLGISQFRIFANAYNMLTFDYLKIADPETQTQGYPTYPTMKILNTGLNISF